MALMQRISSIQEIQEAWQALLPQGSLDTIFVLPQWQQAWWSEFGDDAEPLLLSLPGSQGLDGLAPLMRRQGRITLMGDEDLYDYNDLLVVPGVEDSFYPLLLDRLQEEQWDSLEFFPLPSDSPTLERMPDLASGRGYEVEILKEDVCPIAELPESWDQFLGGLSKKDRHELRRKLRRLEGVGDYRWHCCATPEEVDGNLDSFLALVRLSREDKDRFMTPRRESFFRNAIGAMARLGVVRLFFMEMEGRPVASALCFDYGQSRMLYNSGFNPQYSYYSVGLLLKALCIRDAVETGLSCFDFLRGDEPYKYDLGGKDQQLYRMVVKRS